MCARTTRNSRPICSQPIRVMGFLLRPWLEPLRADKGHDQIGAKRDRHDEAEQRFDHDRPQIRVSPRA